MTPSPPPLGPSPGLISYWRWLLLPALLLLTTWTWLRPDLARTQMSAQGLMQQAADALARGHLSAPDGSGARELYEAVQAMDPDLPEARLGRVQVGRAALARAKVALAQEKLAAAQRDLELARQLQIPRAEWEEVANALRQQALAEVNLDELLEHAETARAQGWLTEAPPQFPGQSAALPLYQQVLALQPGHAAAMRGREEVLAELLEKARAQLRAGDLESAAAAIAATNTYNPGHIDLPDTLARYNEEFATLQQQAARELASGQTDTAIEHWQRLLALAPDNPDALSGIERAAQVLAERAANLGQTLKFDQAERTLQRARELAPSSLFIHTAHMRIARARQGQPGQTPSASLQATDECFEASLAANNLGRAHKCLDASRSQGADIATLSARRRQLALRWIAIGEERLGSGNLHAATAALTAARDTDPTTPGLQALAQRLEATQR